MTSNDHPMKHVGGGGSAGPVGSQPLSAQQMQSLAKQHADALLSIKKDVELRKWAVDQACGLAGSSDEEARVTFHDPVALARLIHAFLIEGAAEEKPK